jgi:signal transduction histidine kinase
MTQAAFSRRENLVMYIVAYAILAAVAVLGFSLASTATARWASTIVTVAFCLVMAAMPSPVSPAWRRHLYLGLQACLTACVMVLHPEWTVFALLFVILSAQAVLLLPPRHGAAWITIFVLISAAVGVYYWGLPGGLMGVLLYAGGYALPGIFAHAVTRVDAARNESQALLAELQEAHQQLQEYAARVEEMAVVEERNRLAREMHDTLGHRLTVAAVQLEGAQRLCSQDPERAASMLGAVREQVRDALGELRGTVATLRTPIEADLRLRSALERLAAHFEQAADVTVHHVLPDDLPHLPDSHRLALYRAAQEALTNVQRHADATQVWLVLNVRDDAVTLLAGDDGRGYSASGDQAGFGLRGLRERATQLGGELHLEPRPGGGTQLSFRLPLPKGEEDG